LRTFLQKIIKTDDIKTLVENFFSLSVLQGANYLLPLITLPYLVRVLGPEKYGLVMFAQAFLQYFVVLTDYGFDLSATREISLHRQNKQKTTEIFSAVILIKLLLMIISFSILLLTVFSFKKFEAEWELYLLTFGIVMGNVLFPVWFFQGMEKMKFVTLLNITAKLIFTVLIFVFIREVSDYILVPLFNGLGFLVAGLISLWLVFRHFGIRWKPVPLSIVLFHLKDSFHFFFSRISLSLYTVTNTFVLGLFTSNILVGYYVAAEKIIRAIEALIHPIVQSLYPYMSRVRNIKLYKRVLFVGLLFSLFIPVVIFLFGDFITGLVLGSQFRYSNYILKIFSLEIPIAYFSTLLGLPLLAALGYKGYFNYSIVFSSIYHIVQLGLLTLIYYLFQLSEDTFVTALILLTLVTHLLILIFRLYPVVKFKLFSLDKEE
jgi:PST family polysaccharide transporter